MIHDLPPSKSDPSVPCLLGLEILLQGGESLASSSPRSRLGISGVQEDLSNIPPESALGPEHRKKASRDF